MDSNRTPSTSLPKLLALLVDAALAIARADGADPILAATADSAKALLGAETASAWLTGVGGPEPRLGVASPGSQLTVPIVGNDGVRLGAIEVIDAAANAVTRAGPAILTELARLAARALESNSDRSPLGNPDLEDRSAFDDAPVGMAVVALNGRFLRVNRALCTLTGYPEPELLDTTFQTITHPADLDVDLAHVAQLIAGETHSYQIEKRYLRKDGTAVWALLSVSAVRDH
ncbi:MAG: PAS domain S-box protein, partial [Thermomicrobiales bacterium]|nr:PAS domain S-box protein [Thermomicrobiales bacterium]